MTRIASQRTAIKNVNAIWAGLCHYDGLHMLLVIHLIRRALNL